MWMLLYYFFRGVFYHIIHFKYDSSLIIVIKGYFLKLNRTDQNFQICKYLNNERKP